jgi:hypothetical protein
MTGTDRPVRVAVFAVERSGAVNLAESMNGPLVVNHYFAWEHPHARRSPAIGLQGLVPS